MIKIKLNIRAFKIELLKKNLTYVDFCEKTGISIGSLGMWLYRNIGISQKNIAKFRKVFNENYNIFDIDK